MSLKKIIAEVRNLGQLNKSKRDPVIPLLAALCMGTPLLISVYFDNFTYGVMACISGLIFVYLPPSGTITNKTLTLFSCSFAFALSYTFGLLFSFDPLVSTIAFGLFSMTMHWITLYYKALPPRSFFFILMAAMGICQPFDLQSIPVKVGLLGLGSMFTCLVALAYTLVIHYKAGTIVTSGVVPALKKNNYADFWEAAIVGLFMFIALGMGHMLQIDNPYWIPISTAAVMQGASRYHIWQRSFHRILGTFFGVGLCYIIFYFAKTPLEIALCLISLQFMIETFITRQYALAVVFITPLTILFAETIHPPLGSLEALLTTRLIDICIGSLLGALGGWLLHKEKIRYSTIRGVKKVRVKIRRNKYRIPFIKPTNI